MVSNFIKSILIGVPIGVTILDLIGYVARVDGISMQPALNPNKSSTDYVFLNRWAVRSLNIKRGEIISLVSPKDPDQTIIKRVVGIQGDLISTLGYKVHVVRVPDGHCWVEGDHTGHSIDSNHFGPVSLGLITAKAHCIVWPPSRWQYIKSFLPESRTPLNIISQTMRAISLVDHLEFDFNGNVLKQGLTLGDVDNDGLNELVVGGENGDLTIFKGENKWVSLTGLGFISCVVIGDILNVNRNSLIIITADGWCYIYNIFVELEQVDDSADQVDGQIFSSESIESEKSHSSESITNVPAVENTNNVDLKRVHTQRIPANVKDVLLADIDGDGLLELVIGLTDRIVRSYRWFNTSDFSGNLVCMNKWECAKQIGSITLHQSKDDVPSLLIAQPGGTFMRIVCQAEDICPSLETTGELSDSGSSRTDSIAGSKIDYQFLGVSRTRNQNISTEIVGNLINAEENEKKGNMYAVATLDGTIMLVYDEVIVWSIAVDHQIFSLHKMDITGSGSDNIVASCWDGQTYILDQDKNSVRFHFEESVQAFNCGTYNARDNLNTTCFVYVTFRNKIYLYYDIPLQKMLCQKFVPDISKLKNVLINEDLDQESKNELVEFLLYGVKNV